MSPPFGFSQCLGCRKCGFKRWGFKEIRGYLRKKAFFLRYPGIFQVLFRRSGKGRKGQKKGKKGRFRRRFPGRAARHPLNPYLLHPFAAAQPSLESPRFTFSQLLAKRLWSIRWCDALGLSQSQSAGMATRGLAWKVPIGPKCAFQGKFCSSPWLWGAEVLLIGPEKAPVGPEKAPICPEASRFPKEAFPPIFSENLGLKPPFVSLCLDFLKNPNRVHA